MAAVVLTFVGPVGRMEAALEQLRLELPGASLTRKASTAVEALVEDSQVAALQAHPEWTVGPLVYADVTPPRPSLARMRSKLEKSG